MSSTLTETASGHKLWPSHFIVRPTGEVVPLIATDELPPNTRISGIPSALDLESTVGMLNLGIQKSSGAYYNLVTTQVTTSTNPQAKSPKGQSAIQICRHWCTHGICKWGQQCKYKHTMPMTLNGLAELGLQDWPAWYRGLNPGFFVGAGGAPNLRGGRLTVAKQKLTSPIPSSSVKTVKQEEKETNLGEQTIERLMRMEKQREQSRDGVKGRGQVLAPMVDQKEKERSVTLMVDRAAVRDARRWEADSEDEIEERSVSEMEARELAIVQKARLVDV